MRYYEERLLYGSLLKNARWRSSSTEWDSSPTKQWAGRINHKTFITPSCERPALISQLKADILLSLSWIDSHKALAVSVGHICSCVIDWVQQGGADPHTDEEAADTVPRTCCCCWPPTNDRQALRAADGGASVGLKMGLKNKTSHLTGGPRGGQVHRLKSAFPRELSEP